MKISVIIPTFNRSSYIIKTLESFKFQSYPKSDYEIIICDNNSTDDTKDVVNQYITHSADYGVEMRYLFEARQGVHYARNTAAKAAAFDMLYFTDDDMIADPALLAEIVKPFLFDERVASATGRVLPIWEKEPPQWILKYFANQYLSLLDPPERFLISKQISFLYSCHQAVRKNVFFEAEGFNPEFTRDRYLGDGESGLNVKIGELGYMFGFNANSVIHHIIHRGRISQKYINRRFANGAVAHAYARFRAYKPSVLRLLAGTAYRSVVRYPLAIASVLKDSLTKRDADIMRFVPAWTYYYIRSLTYDLELAIRPGLRKFVLKRDWLTNDTENF